MAGLLSSDWRCHEVEWEDTDDETAQDVDLLVHGEDALRGLMTQLLGQLLQERENMGNEEDCNNEEWSGSAQASEPNPKVMDVAKGALRAQRERVSMLWDENAGKYQTSRSGIASVLKTTLCQRQGTDNGEVGEGREFLRDWSCDLSSCRQTLTRAEMMTILLDTPRGKAPGPNGVPGLAYKNLRNK